MLQQWEHGEDGLAVGVIEKRNAPQHPDHVPSVARTLGEAHFFINQTSATWSPRPASPKPVSRYHCKCSSPPAVASGGISNSTGRNGTGRARSGWISVLPFAVSRIFGRIASPA